MPLGGHDDAGEASAESPDVTAGSVGDRQDLGSAIRSSRLGHLDPSARPSANALLGAMGGPRGLIESLLPGIVFLILYAVTRNLWLAVLVPLGISLLFVTWRVVQKGQPALAFAGLFGVGISAVVALLTGDARDNFLWGFTVNGVVIAVLLASMLARRPLVGIIAGALTSKPYAWRTQPAKRAVAWRATILWLCVIGARLAVQVPLYLANAVEALAATKLVMGVPLYLAALWVTWLMVRTVLDGEDTPRRDATGTPPPTEIS